MNKEELRDLDAWIAEHVMGWEYKLSGSDPYEDGECWLMKLPHWESASLKKHSLGQYENWTPQNKSV